MIIDGRKKESKDLKKCFDYNTVVYTETSIIVGKDLIEQFKQSVKSNMISERETIGLIYSKSYENTATKKITTCCVVPPQAMANMNSIIDDNYSHYNDDTYGELVGMIRTHPMRPLFMNYSDLHLQYDVKTN